MSSKWLYHSQRWYKQQLVVQRYYMNKDKHIPQGYKNSPLGIIPKEWEVKKIIDFAPLQRGFDLPTNKIIVGEYPVVYSNGILNYHNEYKAEGPGVVTGRSGTIGKVTYVESNYWPHNTSLWVTDFKGNNPKFVYYIYNHIELSRFASGSGVPTLNRNDVHVSKIAIPPTEEQGRIVNVLELWDTAIEKQSELIEKLALRKRALMQQLLTGKKRLPGFIGKWKEVRLRDIGAFFKGNGVPKNSIICEGHKCLTYGDLYTKYDYVISDVKSFIDDSTANISTRILYGDICFAGSGETKEDIGKCAAFIDDDYGYAGGDIIVFRANATNPITLSYILNSDYVIRQKSNMGQGHSVVHIYPYQLEKIKLKLPPQKEQDAIASILLEADKEIDLAKEKLASLQSQKRGLMQQLLTGKKRVV